MKKIIETSKAPGAIGPYSQGFSFDRLVFTSGQLPLDPTIMAFPEGGIKEQTRQSMFNVKAVLEQGGASLETVPKTTCFLADMNDFAALNETYTEFFGTEAARLPKDAKVEIEAVAYRLA
ncbi:MULTISPECIES: Rid family detoxifying hydrolase [unclassified Tatumella]|uniref:Rid family detoxifying hydrolase n=1 Tax=unclassified Tatumella TaxID=2649542 RepID=UPI001BAEB9A4|nr:regulator [Tatumella sp. JGM82]MBS0892284.1 regulator [Tatumella sp. JGM94]MBS0902884.1 regulator [Tatumella sp. JGM100]